MPGIFGDHMVLQQEMKIPVWGWADPGEEVTVTFGTRTAKTKANAAGKWRVDLAQAEANHQPQPLIVAGKNTLKFEDVLVGEVWLCSGQSNMEYGILTLKKYEELKDSEIRVFCLTKSASLTPMDNTTIVPHELIFDGSTGYWKKTPDAGSWNGFSAVGYLFGQRIREITGHPVGLIGSYWGGTPVQAWTSLSGLGSNPALSRYVNVVQTLTQGQRDRYPVVWADFVAKMYKWSKEEWEPYNVAMRQWEAAAKKAREQGMPEPAKPQLAPQPARPGNEGTPTTLFNGMIHPLIPYAIKGVIWYQGESNVGSPDYGVLFSTLITDWRGQWGQGNFPFLFVQIAGYGPTPGDGSRGNWAALRESQTKALALPQTGMAVAIDVGDQKDIHPRNKEPVAQRLALAAEHLAYGKKLVDNGPTYESMKVEKNGLRVTFKNVGSGLVLGIPPSLPGQPAAPAPGVLKGFEIAGTNQQWFVAQAVIDGPCVIVSCDQVVDPVAARYAWGDFPPCNLYNKEGLPAVPFRTDDWNPKAAFETPE